MNQPITIALESRSAGEIAVVLREVFGEYKEPKTL
jgi:hypothetical protein